MSDVETAVADGVRAFYRIWRTTIPAGAENDEAQAAAFAAFVQRAVMGV